MPSLSEIIVRIHRIVLAYATCKKPFSEGTRSLIPKLFERTLPTLKFSCKPLHTQSSLGNADLVAHMSLGLIGFYGLDAAHSPQALGPPAVTKPQLEFSYAQRIKLSL